MLVLWIAFAAGLVTVLAPCVLPVLPIVLSGGSVQGRWRPWGIILGVVLSFSIFTLTLSWLVQRLGLSPNFARTFGIVVLAGLGILFLIPHALEKFEAWISARLARSGQPSQRHGFGGGFVLGLSLGAVWTPCAGPILASVVAAAQTGQVTGSLVGVTVAYAIGAALPMGLIAGLGQRIVSRVRWLSARLNRIQQAFGVILIIMAILMATGLDRKLQAWIIDRTPNWLPQLQQFEQGAPMPTTTSTTKKSMNTLPNYGPAPELTGITGWINSQPQTLKSLRGKVVLVKFWTYTCINCIRTLPYVQAWYDKYHDQGFEILAVHTPEFEFEKIPANVEKAVRDFKITYPVAFDPNYTTWNAYQNRYWPAKYFIDAQGNIRYVHFGEGEYDVSESVIQQLLREAGQTITDRLVQATGAPFHRGQTPETYFGTARVEYAVQKLQPGTSTYELQMDLTAHQWSLGGSWTLTDEYAEAGRDSALEFQVKTKNIYVVMDGVNDHTQPLKVFIDGQPGGQYTISGGVNEPTLYRLAQFPEFGEHRLRLEFPTGNVKLYATTFGDDAPGMTCADDGQCTVQPIK